MLAMRSAGAAMSLSEPLSRDRVGGAGEEEARVRLVGQEHRLALAGEHRLHAALRLVDRGPVGARARSP